MSGTQLTSNDRQPQLDRIFVRIISQVMFEVREDGAFRALQERVLKWAFVNDRNVVGVPDAAWKGDSFEIDAENSENASAVKLEAPKYWAFRLRERHKDPGRVWTTEVGIAECDDGTAIFGVRLYCSERGRPRDEARSVPRFVRGVAFPNESFVDGCRSGPDPWVVDSDAAVFDLVSLVRSPHRTIPIVLISLPEGSENPDDALIDVRGFIRKTVGAVHSVVITASASFELTNQLGREFTAFHGAIRTFNPSFNPDTDAATDHPLVTASPSTRWGSLRSEEFFDFLVNQSLRPRGTRAELEGRMPPFRELKRVAAKLALDNAKSDGTVASELLELAEQNVQASAKAEQEALELLELAEAERDESQARVDELERSYHHLRGRVTSLDTALKAAGSNEADVVPPTDLSDVSRWVREAYAGDIELHDRASKSLEKSGFADLPLLIDVINLIAARYVPMRREGGNQLVDAFDEECAALGLENTKCFSNAGTAKKFGDEYFVRFQGTKRELDWHLKGSNARDQRRAFRLYYFWDDASQRVVIGYLPGHLRNDYT